MLLSYSPFVPELSRAPADVGEHERRQTRRAPDKPAAKRAACSARIIYPDSSYSGPHVVSTPPKAEGLQRMCRN